MNGHLRMRPCVAQDAKGRLAGLWARAEMQEAERDGAGRSVAGAERDSGSTFYQSTTDKVRARPVTAPTAPCPCPCATPRCKRIPLSLPRSSPRLQIDLISHSLPP